MQPADISRLLVGYGFKDPDLTKIDGTTYTFKFVDYNLKRLTQQFGQPSVAANGKVAVFVVPSYGKLGVSPANRLVRFVYTGNHKKLEIDDSHLSKHKTTDELTLLFHKATANPRYRLTYIEKLWTFYNTHKFKAALPKPKFACSPKPLAKKVSPRARGYYQGGNDFTAGTLWLSQRLFNSTLDIMNEIVLHEMCVTGDALIPTDVGLVRMSQIEKAGASKVATMNGTARIEKWWCSGEQPTRKITTAEGSSLRLTCNHPVRVLNSLAQLEWKNAEDLKPGDYLIRRLGTSSMTRSSELPLVEATGYVKLATERFPSEVTAELARLLGYLTAEGTFIDKANPNTVGFFNKDKALIDDYVRCWTACFGYKPAVTCNANNGLYSVVQTRKDIATWLDGIGFKRGKASTKQVPWCILRGTGSMQLQFLKAFCEGDAYLSPGGKFQIKVASRKLIRQLSVMLTALGLPNISGSRIGKYGFKPGQRYYTLRLHDGELSSKAIGAVSPRRKAILKSATLYHRSKQQHQIGKHWKIPYVGALLKDQGLPIRAQKDGGLYPWAVDEICEVTKGLRKQLKHLRGSFVFEKVESNKPTGKVEKVYDMTTSAGEFVANGLVIHNCHQAAWCISKSMDRSDEGHGPVWQGWMRKVGLNPNRYDKLDDTAYADNLERAITEEALTKDLGPRTPVNFFKKLTKVTSVVLDDVIVEYKNRAFRGSFKKQGSKYVFNGVTVSTPAKRIALSYKKFPSTGIYQE